MVATEQRSSEGAEAGAWEPLSTACKAALENTEELQARLAWCEQNFESERLTPAVVAERRVVGLRLAGGTAAVLVPDLPRGHRATRKRLLGRVDGLTTPGNPDGDDDRGQYNKDTPHTCTV